MSSQYPPQMHPDEIVHSLATADGNAVRITLVESPTVPLKPCTEYGRIKTETVDVRTFEAQVRHGSIEDGGITLYADIHLPAAEWERLRLHEHWEDDDAEDWREERYMQIWASASYNKRDSDPEEYKSPVPEDSPIRAAVTENRLDIESPPCPFSRPTVYFDTATAKSVTDYGHARTESELGDVHAVEELDHSLEPETRDKEDPRDLEPLSRPDKPTIEYDELAPLEPTEQLLEAVHTINRHAKRLSEDGDRFYEGGRKAKAKEASVRKDALYAAKTVAIHRFLKADPEVTVEVHDLNGDVEMPCFYFDNYDYSFHQPRRVVDSATLEQTDGIPSLDDAPTETLTFQASADTKSLDLSLSEALERLRAVGIEPNDYLRQTSVVDIGPNGMPLGEYSTTFN